MLEPCMTRIPALLERLDQDTTLITANTRLATVLRQAYDRQAAQQGHRVWLSPDILPWSAWLQRNRQHEELHGSTDATPMLLNEAQDQLLWERIIHDSPAGDLLLQVPATARRAREAAERILAWRLADTALEQAPQNGDSEAFRAWWKQLRLRCRQEDWLLPSRLPDALAIDPDMPREARQIILAGFDELTPQQTALLARLQKAGCAVEWVRFESLPAQAVRCTCLDARDEALQAARWARARLDARPDARIAIVVPDLQAARNSLVWALDHVLTPAVVEADHWEQGRPYNLSLGRPLTEYPLVQCAFDVLGLLRWEVSLESISRLLRSPFIAGWEVEGPARALLDARLRELGELQVTLPTLQYWAGREDKPSHCPLLAAQLGRLRTMQPKKYSSLSAGHWVELFNSWLDAFGWARGRSLSSDEYQTVDAWLPLVSSLGGVEHLLGDMSVDAALRQLQRLATSRIFQPQRPELPVQVLGILETSGLQFDHVWVMGLHDGVWPVAPRPNPFIPLTLQRSLDMPHASAERELAVARRITERLCGCATEVVMSVPQREGDRELRVSPLIEQLPLVERDALVLWEEPLWRERIFAGADRELLSEDTAPPVSDEHARGGSAVFKYQAACPFRAFAELRLGARPLEQAEIGLDSRTRGSLLHRILEAVWKALQDHATLMTMPASELQALVAQAVDGELERAETFHPQTLTRRFRAVETERLQDLTLTWLELERQRVPFVSVEPEKECRVSLGGIEVKLKIDRIDTLADGRKLLIDYKTGRVEPRQWFGDRPEEPQLPLYSAAVEGPVAGLLFAQLQAGKLRFNGVLEEAGLVPQVREYTKLGYTREQESWDSVLAEWRVTLERLGGEFRAGRAEVAPKDFPRTCQYCSLTPLCRIQEQALPGAEVEDEDD